MKQYIKKNVVIAKVIFLKICFFLGFHYTCKI